MLYNKIKKNSIKRSFRNVSTSSVHIWPYMEKEIKIHNFKLLPLKAEWPFRPEVNPYSAGRPSELPYYK